MILSNLFHLILLSSSLSSAVAASCNETSAPIPVPIQNVTVGTNVEVRGALLTVGPESNSKEFALEVNGNANNTYLYDVSGDPAGSCVTTTGTLTCVANRGGLYDPNSSPNWQRSPNTGADSSDETIGTDTVVLDDESLPDVPLDVLGYDLWVMNALGLGPNSTLLSYLVNAGRISSNVYGYWPGLYGTTKTMKGGVVLGGFDKAKVKGSNSTFPASAVDENCSTGLVLPVSEISLEFSNGTSFSLTGRSTSSFCISPQSRTMQLRRDSFLALLRNVGGTYLGRATGLASGQLYMTDGVYNGDLSFTLSSGIKITVPNHQLVTPDRVVSVNGINNFNATTRQINVNEFEEFGLPVLGWTFLTAAYMMVDHDEHTFTLWQNNPTDEQNLVLKSSEDTSQGSQCTASTSGSAALETSSNSDSGSSSEGFPGGVVAGIAVGVVAGVAIAVAGIWFFVRRRRQRQSKASANILSDKPDGNPNMSSSYGGYRKSGKFELPGQPAVQELPTQQLLQQPQQQQPVYELGDYNRQSY